MQKNKETKYHLIFSFWIIVPLLVEAIQVYTLGTGTNLTIFLNMIGFVISMLAIIKDIRFRDFKILLWVYTFYGINFILFPQNRSFFFETPVYILLFIYIPIGALVVRKIVDWDGFFDVFKWFSIAAVACGTFITLFSQVDQLAEYFSYMDFSYFFIPFIGGSYIAFRKGEKYSLFFLLMTLMGIFEILIYGARGAVIFTLIYFFIAVR